MTHRFLVSACIAVCLLLAPATLAGDGLTRNVELAPAPEPIDPPRISPNGDGRKRINRPVTITKSGSYVLTRNIGRYDPSPVVPTIAIMVSNVTIDLNGFTVRGQEPAILAENVSGVTIHSGSVDASDKPILFDNVKDFVVRDLVLTSNEDPAIVVRNGVRGHVENVATNIEAQIDCQGCIIIHNRFPQLTVSGDGNYINGNAVYYVDPW